jgi:uncharacterized membrane protein
MPDHPVFDEPLRRLEHADALDGLVRAGQQLPDRYPPELRSALAGDWLGHPLHPVLTDLPIGFWTTSWVLDLLGGRRSARVATAFVGLGVVSAVPTIASGLVEWPSQTPGRARVAAVHLAANAAATFAYTASFLARVRGRRGRGVALGMLGAGLATAGGLLGGHLAYGSDSADQEGQEAHNGHVPETLEATPQAISDAPGQAPTGRG